MHVCLVIYAKRRGLILHRFIKSIKFQLFTNNWIITLTLNEMGRWESRPQNWVMFNNRNLTIKYKRRFNIILLSKFEFVWDSVTQSWSTNTIPTSDDDWLQPRARLIRRSKGPSLWLYNLSLEVLTVYGDELRLFRQIHSPCFYYYCRPFDF